MDGTCKETVRMEWKLFKNQPPAHTTLHCWHCCHPFDGAPVMLPIAHDDRTDRFKVKGVFCSFSCVKRFNLDAGDLSRNCRAGLIAQLKRRLEGRHTPTIAAPPRYALKMFGGPLDIAEFRASGEGVRYAPIPQELILLEHERMSRTVHVVNDDAPIDDEDTVPDGYELAHDQDPTGATDATYGDDESLLVPAGVRGSLQTVPHVAPQFTARPDDISVARSNAAQLAAKRRRVPTAPPTGPTFNKRTLVTSNNASTSLDNLFMKMNTS